jgi:hypothetical protein
MFLAACGDPLPADAPTGSSVAPPTTTSSTVPTIAREPVTTTTTVAILPPPEVPRDVPLVPRWTAAVASGRLDVYAGPGGDPVRVLDATTILGTPTIVRVLQRVDDWLRVALPGRPVGAEGWVRADDVELFSGDREVVIDLSDRTLQVTDRTGVIIETPVAVGTDRSPTPLGSFFVTDAVRLTNPNGPWGPFAFGLSARSEAITEFNGGDGIIGIHGTSNPGSIGRAASLGCVRVPNETILRLAEIVGVGFPVTIRA